jgi:hypothetical protein
MPPRAAPDATAPRAEDGYDFALHAVPKEQHNACAVAHPRDDKPAIAVAAIETTTVQQSDNRNGVHHA